jgi:UDP-N-acetylglucosamine--N-acetylmuramyl-(pentapeptide) pyrophosphoryl-undecaprenol N-acetylglucosamine transferase
MGERAGLRLIIAGGGTAGHVLPAIAVVAELRNRGELADALWLGSETGVERRAAEAARIPFMAIPTGKLRRYLSLRNLTDAARVPLGILEARRQLRRFRPDVVLSTGGFVSVPAVIAAHGVAPVVTHEQTAILGLANRINARFAAVLAISHDQTAPVARAIHRRVVVTGNPVREGISSGDRARGLAHLGFNPALPVVYVTGGSRGASAINRRIGELLPGILEHTQIIHQTGPAGANPDAATLLEKRSALPETLRRRYRVAELIGDELPDVYAAADVVIGRAGAGTVAELAIAGIPAILIPLPGAGGDEQALNARVLGDAGGAIVLPQHEATPERLRSAMLGLLDDAARRDRMSAAARSVARPEAAARLADQVWALASRRGNVTPG